MKKVFVVIFVTPKRRTFSLIDGFLLSGVYFDGTDDKGSKLVDGKTERK